jgi:hypothetical protein
MRYARLRDKNHQTATAMTAMTIIPMSIFPIFLFYPAVRGINLTALARHTGEYNRGGVRCTQDLDVRVEGSKLVYAL